MKKLKYFTKLKAVYMYMKWYAVHSGIQNFQIKCKRKVLFYLLIKLSISLQGIQELMNQIDPESESELLSF